MARNSKRKINFTDGVKAEVKGQVVTFSGKKGAMDLNVHEQVSIESNEESILSVSYTHLTLPTINSV